MYFVDISKILAVLAFIVCVWVGYQVWVTPIEYSGIEVYNSANGVKTEREVIKLRNFEKVSGYGVIPLLIPIFICLLALWATFKLKIIILALSVLLIILFWVLTIFSIGMAYSSVVILLIVAFAMNLMTKLFAFKSKNYGL
ncbi:MAG: hypothetical protein GQ582_11020 [Methyloprofundus sp.]|nr:hypothetical protein [Methyloprofundus sp.]